VERGAGLPAPRSIFGTGNAVDWGVRSGEKSFCEPLVLPGKRSYNYRLPLKFFGASVADAFLAK